MKTFGLLLVSFVLMLASCRKDSGTISLTYNKATAVYGDINAIRATPLLTSSKTIKNPGKIFIDDQLLLIGEKNEGIHVFNNTNPNAPVQISFLTIPFNKEFYVENNMIYAETQYDFIKIDISDLTNPVLVYRLDNAFGAPVTNNAGEVIIGFTTAVSSETFKINSPEEKELRNNRTLYFDYLNNSIPSSSVPSSFTNNSKDIKGTLNKIALHNDHIYVVGDNTLYTFHNTANQLSKITTTQLQGGMETIYPENNNLFIGTQTSMLIVDVTNPGVPHLEGSYFHPTSCDPVLPKGNIAYLTLRTADFSGCNGDENALHVIDISNLSSPISKDQLTMKSPYGMTIINNYLLVGEGVNGLTIFDITDPIALIKLASKPSLEVYDVMAHPTNPNILLTTNENGLTQYNIDYTTFAITPLSVINY